MIFKRSKITLVTGANGFTGSAIVRALLLLGRQVRAFVEPGTNEENLASLPVERVYGNLLDHASLAKAARTGASRSVIPIDPDQAFQSCPIRHSD